MVLRNEDALVPELVRLAEKAQVVAVHLLGERPVEQPPRERARDVQPRWPERPRHRAQQPNVHRSPPRRRKRLAPAECTRSAIRTLAWMVGIGARAPLVPGSPAPPSGTPGLL